MIVFSSSDHLMIVINDIEIYTILFKWAIWNDIAARDNRDRIVCVKPAESSHADLLCLRVAKVVLLQAVSEIFFDFVINCVEIFPNPAHLSINTFRIEFKTDFLAVLGANFRLYSFFTQKINFFCVRSVYVNRNEKS